MTGRPRDQTVVMTADYSFLSFYPYWGFQGLTSHYANPLAQFDLRAAQIEKWSKLKTADEFVHALDTCPWPPPTVFLMRRGANSNYTLRLAEDVYPNQPERPPLHRRPAGRPLRRPPVRRRQYRPVRAGHPQAGGRRLMITETPARTEELPSSSVTDTGANHRIARLVATVAGLLGALLAIATPLLPVNQTTAQLNWPQNGSFASVDAPLIGYVATDLNISVPCQAAAGLAGPQNAGKTVLLSTVPKQAPKAVDRGLLIQRANDYLVLVVRNVPVVTAPLSQVLSPACQRLTFTAHADRVTAEFVGLTQGPNAEHPGAPLRGERSGYDFRPQIVGVFTDLSGPAPPGLSFSATVDTRYSSSPTPLKMAAMILGLLLTAAALVALHVLDTALKPWHPAPPLPAVALVVDRRAGRAGDRGAGVVAFRRRQHLRRRLHPDHGPGLRTRRLHGQLLPLVRHAGGPVRLVLRPAGAVGPRQHRQHLDAAAHPAHGADVLVGDQPRSHPAPGPRRQAEPRRGVDGGRHVPGGVAAAGQRPAARADHRAGHPADLVLGGARGGHQPAAAGGGRLHHRCADAVLRADGHRLDRRAAGRGRARCGPSCTAGPNGSGCCRCCRPCSPRPPSPRS